MLAGIPVDAELVWELADLVDEPAASTLRNCLKAGRTTFALTIADREQILRALDDPPDGLAELRGVLLQEHEWRVGEGCFRAPLTGRTFLTSKRRSSSPFLTRSKNCIGSLTS